MSPIHYYYKELPNKKQFGFLANEFVNEDTLNEFKIINKSQNVINNIKSDGKLINNIIEITTDKLFPDYEEKYLNWDLNLFGEEDNILIKEGVKIGSKISINIIDKTEVYNVIVKEIINNKKIIIENENWIEKDKEYSIFIKGTYVDDFLTLNYDNITTLTFTGVQLLMNQVEKNDIKINTLENKYLEFENELKDLQNKVNLLLQKNNL
jgi:hypothetical protein